VSVLPIPLGPAHAEPEGLPAVQGARGLGPQEAEAVLKAPPATVTHTASAEALRCPNCGTLAHAPTDVGGRVCRRMAKYRRLVEKGETVKRVSEEVVYSPPTIRKVVGKVTRIGGLPLGGWARADVEPMAPVMTVRDEHGVVREVSLGDASGGTQLGKFMLKFIESRAMDLTNRDLVDVLLKLRAALNALPIPAA
jgi:hypothetical protein